LALEVLAIEESEDRDEELLRRFGGVLVAVDEDLLLEGE
jgi:hypothetical protein